MADNTYNHGNRPVAVQNTVPTERGVALTPQAANPVGPARGIYAKTDGNLYYFDGAVEIQITLGGAIISSPLDVREDGVSVEAATILLNFTDNFILTNPAVGQVDITLKYLDQSILNTIDPTANGTIDLGSTLLRFKDLYTAGTIYGGIGGSMGLFSGTSDGASAVAFGLNTANAFVTSGAKLLALLNNSVEKFSVDKDGALLITGNIRSNTSMSFQVDADNNGSESFSWLDGTSATLMSLDEAGLLTLAGKLTSTEVDGALAVAYSLDTVNLISTPGALLLALRNQGSLIASVDPSGNTNIGSGSLTAGHLIPVGHNTYDIGQDLVRYRDIYYAGTLFGGASPMNYMSKEADGASAVAHVMDTSNALTTAGAKLFSLRNNGVEKFSIDKDGTMTGNIALSDPDSIDVFIDNDNTSTTDTFTIYHNVLAPNPSDKLFEVRENGEVEIYGGPLIGGASPFTLQSKEADGASAVGFVLDTQNTLTTDGSKLLSIKNGGIEYLNVRKGTNIYGTTDSAITEFSDNAGTVIAQLSIEDPTYSEFLWKGADIQVELAASAFGANVPYGNVTFSAQQLLFAASSSIRSYDGKGHHAAVTTSVEDGSFHYVELNTETNFGPSNTFRLRGPVEAGGFEHRQENGLLGIGAPGSIFGVDSNGVMFGGLGSRTSPILSPTVFAYNKWSFASKAQDVAKKAGATITVINNSLDGGEIISVTDDLLNVYTITEGVEFVAGGTAAATATNIASAINTAYGSAIAAVNFIWVNIVVPTAGAVGNSWVLSVTDGATTNFDVSPFQGGSDEVIGFEFDTENLLSSASAKLLSLKNNGVEKLYIDKDGVVFGGNSPFRIIGRTADGGSAVAHELDTVNTLSTSGAKLFSLKNNGVEKFAIDKDGSIVVGGGGYLVVVEPSAGGAGIQAAMNAVSAAGGGIVQLKVGTYNVAAPIVPNLGINGVTLRGVGDGTILSYSGIAGNVLTVAMQHAAPGTVGITPPAIGATSVYTTTLLDAASFLVGMVVSIKGLDADGRDDATYNVVKVNGIGGTGEIQLEYPIDTSFASATTIVSATGGQNIHVQDLKIIKNTINTPITGISYQGLVNSSMSNITLDGLDGDDLVMGLGVYNQLAINCAIRNCRILNSPAAHAIQMTGSINCTVEDNLIQDSVATLIYNGAIWCHQQTYNAKFLRNRIISCGGVGIFLYGYGIARRLLISGNFIENTYSMGIQAGLTGESIIENNTLVNCGTFSGAPGIGIPPGGSWNILVAKNVTRRCRGGVTVWFGCSDIVIDGNIIEGSTDFGMSLDAINVMATNNLVRGSTTGGGIYIARDNCLCSNNRVLANTGTGIYVATTNSTISGNVTKSNTGDGLYLTSGATDNIIIGNNCNGDGLTMGSGTGNDFIGNKA